MARSRHHRRAFSFGATPRAYPSSAEKGQALRRLSKSVSYTLHSVKSVFELGLYCASLGKNVLYTPYSVKKTLTLYPGTDVVATRNLARPFFENIEKSTPRKKGYETLFFRVPATRFFFAYPPHEKKNKFPPKKKGLKF